MLVNWVETVSLCHFLPYKTEPENSKQTNQTCAADLRPLRWLNSLITVCPVQCTAAACFTVDDFLHWATYFVSFFILNNVPSKPFSKTKEVDYKWYDINKTNLFNTAEREKQIKEFISISWMMEFWLSFMSLSLGQALPNRSSIWHSGATGQEALPIPLESTNRRP